MKYPHKAMVSDDKHDDVLARYETAKKIFQGIAPSDNSLVCNDAVFPHWIEGSTSFWYLRQTRLGKEYRLVDAMAVSNEIAFDHPSLVAAYKEASGTTLDPDNLAIKMLDINLTAGYLHFFADDKHWYFYPDIQDCKEVIAPPPKGLGTLDGMSALVAPKQELPSPDGTQIVFAKGHNLWIRDVNTGQERALTTDGEELYSYDQWSIDNSLQAVWSPDGKKLFAAQLDQRGVTKRPYIEYVPFDGSLHPKATQQVRAYPGDKDIGSWRLKVFEVATGKELRVDYGALSLVSVAGTFFSEKRGWWSEDSRALYFIDENRGATTVSVNRVEIASGRVTKLFEETSESFVKLAHTSDDLPLFLPLPKTEELVWFSERSGWGHLHLYDLRTGELKHQITSGDWVVREVHSFDADRRELLIQTAGRHPNVSPYYADICTVHLDTGEIREIAAGNYEHTIYKWRSLSFAAIRARDLVGYDSIDVHGVSPDKNYIVATRSRVDTPPESILYRWDGKEEMVLEVADVHGLPEGWIWPEPFKGRAADGETDVYGTIFYPPDFSEEQSYPVIDHIHGIRYFSSVPVGSFCNSAVLGAGYNQCACLAALGFIVVSVEGRGCPRRSKAWQDHRFGDAGGGNDPDDHVFVIQELAKTRPYMDITKVGMSGMDASCSMLYGFLKHQDFYKAGVFQVPLDSQFSAPGFVESYEGLSPNHEDLERGVPLEDYAPNLEGRLLLISGMFEFQTPAGTFRLVEALQKANKDFDMLMLPNMGTDPLAYTVRRDWDFIVRHLQDVEPPRDFTLTSIIELSDESFVDHMENLACSGDEDAQSGRRLV